MNKEHDKARENILNDVDAATAPERMTQREALEWLDELASDIEARADAIREEIGE